MKQRFGQRQVFLPISEPIFQFDPAGLYDADVREFSGLWIYLQQALVELGVGRGYRGVVVRGGGFGLGLFAARTTAQDHVALRCGGVCTHIQGLAELREFSLARQQGERSAPIRALFDGSASHGMVGGNVKPDGLAVGDEELLFRRLIFPTHSAGSAEINLPGFGLKTLAAIAISFEKNGLKCFGVVITSLKSTSGGGSARTDIGLRGL